jgi:transglutaminase-like putative cysteine protease
MHRRDLLKSALAAGAVATGSLSAGPLGLGSAPLRAQDAGVGWRSFSVTTKLSIKTKGATSAWVPVPSTIDPGWVRAEPPVITGNAEGRLAIDPVTGAQVVAASWPEGAGPAELVVTSRVATRDRQVDLDRPGERATLPEAQRALYTRPTDLIPIDGIVRDTAVVIVADATSDLAKARAIYEWVVDNTFRDPRTRGCGTGDVAAMLKSGNLGGKCADINALFVGLARAAGLPARDVYGIRVAPSRRGYRSLGAATELISKSQHCRAEVWVDAFGWVPVDPADVRKVALEEPPGNLPLTAEPVRQARATLFGAWEMNWVPFNTAHDLDLPGPGAMRVPFLMYPTGVTGGTHLDSLDPEAFGYTVTSREIVS